MSPSYVLVTGATGFIGAHVVDALLRRGLKVRGATRSEAKGKAMKAARPEYAAQLDFVTIYDFINTGVFDVAVKDIDAVIHVASPFSYHAKDNEKEIVTPAINGVKSILDAAAKSKITRIVITSSFAAIIDVNREAPPFFTYTAADWNPITYAEATDPANSAVLAYHGSKKFSELEAWRYIETQKPAFDIVTLCPPMTFGPVVHPVFKFDDPNESNSLLWKVARGDPIPITHVPFWIDVRDLAEAHVAALLSPKASNKRFVPSAPGTYSFSLAARVMKEEFPWARDQIANPLDDDVNNSHALKGDTIAYELGILYRSFKETVIDLVAQAVEMEWKSE